MVGSANGDGGVYGPAPARTGVAARPGPAAAADGPAAPDRGRTMLVWIAAVGIVAAAAVMVAVSVAGPSLSVVAMPKPTAGPPWWIGLHPSPARSGSPTSVRRCWARRASLETVLPVRLLSGPRLPWRLLASVHSGDAARFAPLLPYTK